MICANPECKKRFLPKRSDSNHCSLYCIKRNKFLVKKWKNLETLIIDEISMMSSALLEKLELLARLIRNNDFIFVLR